MSSSFGVCTYNLGTNVNDYFALCQYLDPSLEENTKTQEERDRFSDKYAATEKITSEKLENAANIFCLQEVGDFNKRPLIQKLKERKFHIVHFEREGKNTSFDTALALDSSRFKDVINHSIGIQISTCFVAEAAIASALDTQSHQRVVFVSLHVPGFNLSKETLDENEKDVIAEGDLYCREVVKKLSEITGSSVLVVGADMNANPEKWAARFTVFSDKGFQVLRTGAYTNVNPTEPNYAEREIDFIFVRENRSLFQKLAAVFCRSVQSVAKIVSFQENPLGWDAAINASDHLPVLANISISIVESLIYRIWLSFCHLFVREKQPAEVV